MLLSNHVFTNTSDSFQLVHVALETSIIRYVLLENRFDRTLSWILLGHFLNSQHFLTIRWPFWNTCLCFFDTHSAYYDMISLLFFKSEYSSIVYGYIEQPMKWGSLFIKDWKINTNCKIDCLIKFIKHVTCCYIS